MLDEAALRDLMEEMKRDGVPINGFLTGARSTSSDRRSPSAYAMAPSFLQEMHFEKAAGRAHCGPHR